MIAIESISNFLTDLTRTLRVADLLDIMLVSGFLFVIITWVQQSTSRHTSRSFLIVASTFALIYILARFFEMYLIEALIEGLFVVLLLVTIVAFQSDIRRLIDRFGTWNPFSRSAPDSSSSTINFLTEATAKMAESKTGALIAIKGGEPWDHLMQGGIDLGGTVSQPLVRSLFNPKAPGHDGAVLLEGDQIVKFAAHLPLSSHLPEVSQSGGTRHAAALGLSEQCDAFVIVVSEERGTISVAYKGELTTLTSVSQLKERLTSFWKKHYDSRFRDRPVWWRRQMPRTALLSVVLAALLWLVFAYRPDTIYRAFTVPIELRNLETGWELVEPAPPSNATVTLAGSELAFESLEPSALAVSLDLEDIDEGLNEFVIDEDNLSLPTDLYLYRVEPSTVQIRAQRIRSIRVPVKVRTTGSVPDSLVLTEMQSTPDSVTLTIPADTNTPPSAVSTQPIELEGVVQSSTIVTNLDLPAGTQLSADQESTVSVSIQIQPRPR